MIPNSTPLSGWRNSHGTRYAAIHVGSSRTSGCDIFSDDSCSFYTFLRWPGLLPNDKEVSSRKRAEGGAFPGSYLETRGGAGAREDEAVHRLRYRWLGRCAPWRGGARSRCGLRRRRPARRSSSVERGPVHSVHARGEGRSRALRPTARRPEGATSLRNGESSLALNKPNLCSVASYLVKLSGCMWRR